MAPASTPCSYHAKHSCSNYLKRLSTKSNSNRWKHDTFKGIHCGKQESSFESSLLIFPSIHPNNIKPYAFHFERVEKLYSAPHLRLNHIVWNCGTTCLEPVTLLRRDLGKVSKRFLEELPNGSNNRYCVNAAYSPQKDIKRKEIS